MVLLEVGRQGGGSTAGCYLRWVGQGGGGAGSTAGAPSHTHMLTLTVLLCLCDSFPPLTHTACTLLHTHVPCGHVSSLRALPPPLPPTHTPHSHACFYTHTPHSHACSYTHTHHSHTCSYTHTHTPLSHPSSYISTHASSVFGRFSLHSSRRQQQGCGAWWPMVRGGQGAPVWLPCVYEGGGGTPGHTWSHLRLACLPACRRGWCRGGSCRPCAAAAPLPGSR